MYIIAFTSEAQGVSAERSELVNRSSTTAYFQAGLGMQKNSDKDMLLRRGPVTANPLDVVGLSALMEVSVKGSADIKATLKADFNVDVKIARGIGQRADPFVIEACSAAEAVRTQLDLLRGLG